VIAVLVLPYLIWLIRADALALPAWPGIADLGAEGRCTGPRCSGGVLLAMSGFC